MDLGLTNKRALVAGGRTGLGRAVAEALAAEGAAVAIVSRDGKGLARAAAEIEQQSGSKAVGIPADLANVKALPALYAEACDALGGIDILFNISGRPAMAAATAVTTDTWRSEFESIVAGTIALTDLVLPEMRQRRWGRILTIGSMGVVEPLANMAVSNALRSALAGWSKTLAGEVARDGVTVNLLLPVRVETERTRALDVATAERTGKSPAEVAAANTATIPVGRYGTTAEFGALVAFVASQHAGFITGSMIRIDGGQMRSL
jgi:3-oxoacyl-[acyl-carrier protein] reductase